MSVRMQQILFDRVLAGGFVTPMWFLHLPEQGRKEQAPVSVSCWDIRSEFVETTTFEVMWPFETKIFFILFILLEWKFSGW